MAAVANLRDAHQPPDNLYLLSSLSRTMTDPSDKRSSQSPGLLHIAGYAVHLYTASGAVCALLTAQAIFENQNHRAFGWMILAVLIDATDGTLARAVNVRERLPQLDGARLDDIVDYLNERLA